VSPEKSVNFQAFNFKEKSGLIRRCIRITMSNYMDFSENFWDSVHTVSRTFHIIKPVLGTILAD
jgi:hypothetical protein